MVIRDLFSRNKNSENWMKKAKYRWKIIVLGDPTVGKTSLMQRYTERKFNNLYIPTVGVQVSIKEVPVIIGDSEKEQLIQLNIWDISGQSKFRKVRRIFCEGADGYLLLYSITQIKSFKGIWFWLSDIEKLLGKKPGILIGNKVDLFKDRVISEWEGEEVAGEHGIGFYETSAKTGVNIDKVFHNMTRKIFIARGLEEINKPKGKQH